MSLAIVDVDLGGESPSPSIAVYDRYLLVGGYTSNSGLIQSHGRGYLVDLTTFTQVNCPSVRTDPAAPDICDDGGIPIVIVSGEVVYVLNAINETIYKRSLPDMAELASLALPDDMVPLMAKIAGDYLYVVTKQTGDV